MDPQTLQRLMMMRQQQPQQPMDQGPPVIDEAQMLQQMQGMQPQQQGGPTLAQYIQGMTAQDPKATVARQAPPQFPMAQAPTLASLWQMLAGKPEPDAAISDRLGQQVGGMLRNNQAHAQRLDDFQRERTRNSMMLNQLRGQQ